MRLRSRIIQWLRVRRRVTVDRLSLRMVGFGPFRLPGERRRLKRSAAAARRLVATADRSRCV